MKTITIEIPDGKKAEWVNGVLTLVDDKPQDPNEKIKSFEDAVRFLGIDEVDNVEHLFYAQGFLVSILASDEDIIRKINAYAKLITIATAWNEIDRFVPDWEYTSQYKYFPLFEYSRDAAGFVCTNTLSTATVASANYGSRLCFKTRERAKQFGEQFIDLWNDLLR